MMMAAGVDAAGNLDVDVADLLLLLRIGEMVRQILRQRNRARGGQGAIIEAGAAQNVCDKSDIGLAQLFRA